MESRELVLVLSCWEVLEVGARAWTGYEVSLRFIFQAWNFGFLLDFMMDFELDRLRSHLPSFLQLEVQPVLVLAEGSDFTCMHACVLWTDCGLSQGAW